MLLDSQGLIIWCWSILLIQELWFEGVHFLSPALRQNQNCFGRFGVQVQVQRR